MFKNQFINLMQRQLNGNALLKKQESLNIYSNNLVRRNKSCFTAEKHI